MSHTQQYGPLHSSLNSLFILLLYQSLPSQSPESHVNPNLIEATTYFQPTYAPNMIPS